MSVLPIGIVVGLKGRMSVSAIGIVVGFKGRMSILPIGAGRLQGKVILAWIEKGSSRGVLVLVPGTYHFRQREKDPLIKCSIIFISMRLYGTVP